MNGVICMAAGFVAGAIVTWIWKQRVVTALKNDMAILKQQLAAKVAKL